MNIERSMDFSLYSSSSSAFNKSEAMAPCTRTYSDGSLSCFSVVYTAIDYTSEDSFAEKLFRFDS